MVENKLLPANLPLKEQVRDFKESLSAFEVIKKKFFEEKPVTITEKEYLELTNASALLRHLEKWGVDNWDGYSYAYQEYLKEIGEYDDCN